NIAIVIPSDSKAGASVELVLLHFIDVKRRIQVPAFDAIRLVAQTKDFLAIDRRKPVVLPPLERKMWRNDVSLQATRSKTWHLVAPPPYSYDNTLPLKHFASFQATSLDKQG